MRHPDPTQRTEWLSSPIAHQFQTAIPEAPAKEVLSALMEDPKLLRFLARHPLESLEFSGRLPTSWYGEYEEECVIVNAFREPDTYGKEFVAGELASVSCAGKRIEEAMQRSLYHEVGHHVLYVLGNPEIISQVQRLLRSRRSFPVSERAKWNALEYFAETFSAYRFEGSLADKDPEGYDMVEKILGAAWKL